MKTNVWMTLAALMGTTALAQQTTNPPPAAPVPSAPAAAPAVAPAKSPAPAATSAKTKKKAAAKQDTKAAAAPAQPALVEKPVFLSPGKGTITGNNVNVRGKPTIFSEVVTQLDSGDIVTVIEQVFREKAKPGDPTQWAKIAIPPEAHVWVHSSYIDRSNHVVLPKRLNVRTGPGENYSVVGLLEQGAPVKELSMKGDWMEIESPADAYAFVAATYVKQEGAAPKLPPMVSIAPEESEPKPTPAVTPEPAPTPAIVPEPTPLAKTTTEVPPPTPAPKPEPTPAPSATEPAPAPESATIPPPVEEPPPKRVVQHEGIVKNTWSIQAPTKFALVDPVSGKTVNYLYTSSTNLDLRLWKGHRIIVTGEEGLDERWKNTPVITIQRIQVVE